MKKLLPVKDEATNKNLDEIFNNIGICDLSSTGENSYVWDSLPSPADKEKPWIRPCLVSGTFYLAIFNPNNELWYKLTASAV